MTDRTARTDSVYVLHKRRDAAAKRIKAAQAEMKAIERALERQQPKTVYYTIDGILEGASEPICFYTKRANDERRRVHPRRSGGGTKYPQDLCADEIEAWMKREGFTHVFADTNDDETSPECIARGEHTRAAFIRWWRQLEEE